MDSLSLGSAIPFEYRPLGVNQIRLLRVERSTSDHSIRAIIKNVLLTADVAYRALSYRWGEEDLNLRISLYYENGKTRSSERPFVVNKNLIDFLSMMAQKERMEHQWLWIDQICINQPDLVERADQIAMMADIYSLAKEVWIWLGPEFEGTDAFMDALNAPKRYQFEDEMRDMTRGRHSREHDWKGNTEDVQRCMYVYQDTLRRVLNLDYWSRVWICQEIVLAQDIAILLGTKSVQWDRFYRHFGYMRSAQGSTPMDLGGGDTLTLGFLTEQHHRLPWLSVLIQMEHRSCRHFEDRIYGVMGLIGATYRVHPIEISTPLDLLSNVLRKSIKQILTLKTHGVKAFGWPLNNNMPEAGLIVTDALAITCLLRTMLKLEDVTDLLDVPGVVLEALGSAYIRETAYLTNENDWRFHMAQVVSRDDIFNREDWSNGVYPLTNISASIRENWREQFAQELSTLDVVAEWL